MEPWIFSDGTEITLGGNVTGDSEHAKALRVLVKDIRFGSRPHSSFFGVANNPQNLDLSVPHLLDSWLRNRFGGDVRIVSGPSVEYPILESEELRSGDETVLY